MQYTTAIIHVPCDPLYRKSQYTFLQKEAIPVLLSFLLLTLMKGCHSANAQLCDAARLETSVDIFITIITITTLSITSSHHHIRADFQKKKKTK
jgi:hypothetical protein